VSRPRAPYTRGYYKKKQVAARRSAEEVIPLVLELLQPASAVDVGCGAGTWLSVLVEHGVRDILGLDGSHIDHAVLEIPAERFRDFDLSRPFRLDRRFDLVLSLEVAEHLPPECAEGFVASLVSLGEFVLFSAAIPSQGGRGHVNEQWPDYWARRFQEHGHVAIDCIRRRI
jgi:2-polyprenyl-3-methyl-5-hydroxy-6-metoxy-1,4-benzoquinol methylase